MGSATGLGRVKTQKLEAQRAVDLSQRKSLREGGLGLAICRMIADRHNGNLPVLSARPCLGETTEPQRGVKRRHRRDAICPGVPTHRARSGAATNDLKSYSAGAAAALHANSIGSRR